MTGPVVIAYDATPASELALREGGALLAGRPALVLVVYKPGLAFEAIALPASSIGLPPAPLDIRATHRLAAGAAGHPSDARQRAVPRRRVRERA